MALLNQRNLNKNADRWYFRRVMSRFKCAWCGSTTILDQVWNGVSSLTCLMCGEDQFSRKGIIDLKTGKSIFNPTAQSYKRDHIKGEQYDNSLSETD